MEGALKFTRRGTLEGKKVVIQGAGNVGKGLHDKSLCRFSNELSPKWTFVSG